LRVPSLVFIVFEHSPDLPGGTPSMPTMWRLSSRTAASGHDDCGGQARQAHPQLPEELRGSLTWDQGKEIGWPQVLHGCHQRADLFLRSAQSLAAREQLEYQRPAVDSPSREEPISRAGLSGDDAIVVG